jgi:hypothetical protein
MKLKKGSAAAKAYMAKIRAKRKKVKKSTIAKPKRAARKVVKAAKKKAAKKMTSIHKDSKSHNVRISVMSGNVENDFFEKNRAEYAKYNHLSIHRSQRSTQRGYALLNGKRITLKRAHTLADQYSYVGTSVHYPYVITDYKQRK